MKRVTISLLVILMACQHRACAGAEPDGDAQTPAFPTQAIRALYEAVRAGDMDKARLMMMPFKTGRQTVDRELELLRARLDDPQKALTPLEEKVQGDVAVVITVQPDRSPNRTFLFRRGGQWKIADDWNDADGVSDAEERDAKSLRVWMKKRMAQLRAASRPATTQAAS